MRDRFVTLAEWFAAPVPEPEPAPAPAEETIVETATVAPPEQPSDDALADVRRFRAALADALDVAVHDLLREIAVDVVGRELQLASADVRAIVERARERYGFEDPIAIRVHPDDRAALASETVEVLEDARLRRGDVVLEIHSGTIDATLGARLDRVIAAMYPA